MIPEFGVSPSEECTSVPTPCASSTDMPIMSAKNAPTACTSPISNLLDIKCICHTSFDNATLDITSLVTDRSYVAQMRIGSCPVLRVHFRIRYSRETVVIRAASYHAWTPQLYVPHKFRNGDHCHLYVHVYRSHYSVCVNGKEVLRFFHYIPSIDSE
ncbi:hypothetical protein AAVH_00914 [Aphelenchoides avenae]|nr:hypothetical protein AAVH_00914 [Aphelenchus avenae]